MTASPSAPQSKPDRMAKLQTVPRLREEALTIKYMAQAYCAHFHGSKRGELCDECRAFLEYARKRLACCPYGAEKPVCAKCRIHCYKPEEKETARRIMRWAGPRLLFSHPILTVKHLCYSRIPAPEKPRNTRGARPGASASGADRKPEA